VLYAVNGLRRGRLTKQESRRGPANGFRFEGVVFRRGPETEKFFTKHLLFFVYRNSFKGFCRVRSIIFVLSGTDEKPKIGLLQYRAARGVTSQKASGSLLNQSLEQMNLCVGGVPV
jgi:hypothetical protein